MTASSIGRREHERHDRIRRSARHLGQARRRSRRAPGCSVWLRDSNGIAGISADNDRDTGIRRVGNGAIAVINNAGTPDRVEGRVW